MNRGGSGTERPGRDPLAADTRRAISDETYASLLERLVTAPERCVAARALARALGAEDLLVFLRDPEVGVLLPAPGFPKTLPDGRQWRAFLNECIDLASARSEEIGAYGGYLESAHQGRLRAPGATERLKAVGVASGDDTVLVLLGGAPNGTAVAVVVPYLPLVVRALEAENAEHVAAAHARVARDEAARAEALADALETARAELQRALDDTRESRRRLQQQATAVQTANEELERRGDELRAQAEKLEAQANELQVLNEELKEQTDALRSTNEQLAAQVAATEAAMRALEVTRAEAERAQRTAENANRSKSEFLAAMSHELRTPLNAIGGHVQLVELGIHGPVTDAQREALERVQRSQQHLLSLINDVLNFAKLEAGRVEYTTQNLPLADVVADVAPMIEPQLTGKGLVYEVSIGSDVRVRADREKLQQILLNLLSNAVKFTEPGGRVTVDASTREEAGRELVFLRVSDTGIGIPREKQDAVFDPFVQIHRGLTRTGEGTGLGLAISRDLARGMDGDLRVRSEEGRGSVFTLALPRGT